MLLSRKHPTGRKVHLPPLVIEASHWHAAEFDGEDPFFDYAILSGDMQSAESGCLPLQELKDVKVRSGKRDQSMARSASMDGGITPPP